MPESPSGNARTSPPEVKTEPKRHRFLFLQASSIFESYGGIEYYLDDLESLTADAFGGENIWALIPQRTKSPVLAKTEYQTKFVPFSSNRWVQKIQNRVSLSYWREAARLVRSFRPTLIVNGHVSLGPIAFSLSRTLGVPYLTCVYGTEAWGGLWPQDEASLRASNGIVSISHWTKRILMERGYPANQIQIVQPRVALPFESNPAPQPRSGKDFTLLTVSRLDASERYKGQDHVIAALAELKRTQPSLKVRYLIHGDGNDKARLKALVQKEGLSDQVEFHPAAKRRDEIAEVFRQADLYVMPSRFGFWEGKWRGEGFGIVYVEAAAFGVPSIAYRCGGATDIIRHGENGMLVEPDNIGELARTIGQLAGDRAQVAWMGSIAYRDAMKRFTREPIRRQIVDTFNSF